ncbi:MAG: glycosyltransferase family 25 protein [Chloroflexota bacterium]
MNEKLDLPIWVLNLERETERRRFITQQLNELGIDFELIKAVDKETLTTEELSHYSKQAAFKSEARELSRDEIGCVLSHANMWQRMVDEKIPEVLILEDDVRVSRALFDVLANRHKFPDDADFINFSTQAPQISFGEYISEIYRVSEHQTDANMTSAYWITNRGAQKLLAQTYPIRWPADGLTGRTYMTGLVSYGIYPNVAMATETFESNIWKNSSMPLRNHFCGGLSSLYHACCYSYRIWRNAFRQTREIIVYGILKHEAKILNHSSRPILQKEVHP